MVPKFSFSFSFFFWEFQIEFIKRFHVYYLNNKRKGTKQNPTRNFSYSQSIVTTSYSVWRYYHLLPSWVMTLPPSTVLWEIKCQNSHPHRVLWLMECQICTLPIGAWFRYHRSWLTIICRNIVHSEITHAHKTFSIQVYIKTSPLYIVRHHKHWQTYTSFNPNHEKITPKKRVTLPLARKKKGVYHLW